ncbi:unnamed protein product [Musa acuminata subsp. malaccensis]|uniref:(wild Malaysian banana) hypothetical protein n=1 Tax=Musa acuminata subsp. malaccensis TaxID=214687 RepID=A0A804KPE0_MUSAM|nr:unnamed protein product [Musa acuminata subsp. malaccensis]
MPNFFILSSFSLRQPILGKGARVVAMTLDQVYMLKVEGIGFRFLPDPLQIKKCSSIKSANVSRSFDGVPVFQTFWLRKRTSSIAPIYFQKEDIERELLKVSKASSGSEFSHDIMVESLEDVLKNWSCTEHINEVSA